MGQPHTIICLYVYMTTVPARASLSIGCRHLWQGVYGVLCECTWERAQRLFPAQASEAKIAYGRLMGLGFRPIEHVQGEIVWQFDPKIYANKRAAERRRRTIQQPQPKEDEPCPQPHPSLSAPSPASPT